MYVFPGIGLGTILSKSTIVTQSMIYASAVALSQSLLPDEVSQGWLYPDIGRIREVSVIVAMGVIQAAEQAGVARETHIQSLDEKDLKQWVQSKMYEPQNETTRFGEEIRAIMGDGAKTRERGGSHL